MKILQVCPYAMARPGGVQRHVRDLTAWLNTQGHPTRILAPPAPGQRPRVEDPLHELGRSRTLAVHGTAFEISLAAPWTIARAARAWGADVLHLHTPWTPLLPWQIARALALPIVTTVHATLPEADGTAVVDRYIRRSAHGFLQRSRAVLVPSPAPVPMLRRLVDGLDPLVLPPAVDLSGFQPEAKRVGSLLFLGRLEPRKGVDVLLSAWPTIAAAHPEARLTVAGDGPLRDAVVLTPGVSYVGRPSDAEAKRLLAQADLVLAPAPYGESYGLVLAEAMASGAVPVAAANAGYAHILKGLPELLVPVRDSAALAQAVSSLLAQDREALRARVIAEAAASDISIFGPRYLGLLERLGLG